MDAGDDDKGKDGGSDYEHQEWQARQAQQDQALEKQREKERKARERSARNAKRKLERLRAKLGEIGDLTDWEDEFSESVSERIDQYGAAFHDREKGRPGDALSFSQKRIVAALNAKVKAAAKSQKNTGDPDGEPKRHTGFKRKSSFKSKTGFTPRVRRIEDDEGAHSQPEEPYIPVYSPERVKKPFLRIVKDNED